MLLVDDETAMLRSLSRVFTRQGWSCETATSPLGALDVLGCRAVDALVADHNMEPFDGIELCRRAHGAGFAGPVVIYSGYASPTLRESAARAALGSASPSPQGIAAFGNTFPFGNLNPGPSLGSDMVNALLNAAGFGDVGNVLQQLHGGFNEQGPTDRGFVNMAGPGTEPGAMLAQSGAGRMVAQQIAAQHGLHLGGGPASTMFKQGGLGYGRGTPEQWTSGLGQALTVLVAKAAILGGTAAIAPELVPYVFLTLASFQLQGDSPIKKTPQRKGSPGGGGGGGTRSPVGPGSGVSPNPVYYPAGSAVQSGGAARISNVMRAALVEAIKRMGQQAHDQASSSGAGGSTSIAPERVVLHGMKHPYDWLTMRRVVG